MKSLTSIALKLLGIVFFYWSLTNLIGLVLVLPSDLKAAIPEYYVSQNIIGNAIYFLITLTMGYLLTFRTETINRLLNLKDKKVDLSSISSNTILYSGIKLIGIYVFITGSGRFIQRLIYGFIGLDRHRESVFADEVSYLLTGTPTVLLLIAQLLPIVLSVICIAHTDFLIKLISKNVNKSD